MKTLKTTVDISTHRYGNILAVYPENTLDKFILWNKGYKRFAGGLLSIYGFYHHPKHAKSELLKYSAINLS